jgi:chemotaxis-related protein WspD
MTTAVTPMDRRKVDDCWSRIGIGGDKSCPKLSEHVHCRNCEVYSKAARALLDMDLPADDIDRWTKHVAEPLAQHSEHTDSVLVCRSGTECLGLPTAQCHEVVSDRTIRSVPHRRNPAVLGLANIHGELVVCVSLATLLGIQAHTDSGTRRLLVINGASAPTALRVDEAYGTYRFNARDLARPPAVSASSASTAIGSSVRGILRWRDRTIGVLDEAALMIRVTRVLA